MAKYYTLEQLHNLILKITQNNPNLSEDDIFKQMTIELGESKIDLIRLLSKWGTELNQLRGLNQEIAPQYLQNYYMSQLNHPDLNSWSTEELQSIIATKPSMTRTEMIIRIFGPENSITQSNYLKNFIDVLKARGINFTKLKNNVKKSLEMRKINKQEEYQSYIPSSYPLDEQDLENRMINTDFNRNSKNITESRKRKLNSHEKGDKRRKISQHSYQPEIPNPTPTQNNNPQEIEPIMNDNFHSYEPTKYIDSSIGSNEIPYEEYFNTQKENYYNPNSTYGYNPFIETTRGYIENNSLNQTFRGNYYNPNSTYVYSPIPNYNNFYRPSYNRNPHYSNQDIDFSEDSNSGVYKIPSKNYDDRNRLFPSECKGILSQTRQIQKTNRVTIVFDIDNVLAICDVCSPQAKLFFQQKGAIINVRGLIHYILPGVLELLRVLFSMPSVKVAFFSAGKKERNELLVKQLLLMALGESLYSQVASEIIICSRDQLTSEGKKDISLAIAPEDRLEHTIFIDNTPQNVYYGQTKNYLHSETVESKHFNELNEDEALCNSPNDALFRKVNAIFYLTGVLLDCIQNKDKEAITQKLFALQFVPSQAPGQGLLTFVSSWDQPKTNLALYEKGLQVLQRYNPKLTLITSSSYKECILQPSSEQYQCINNTNNLLEKTNPGTLFQLHPSHFKEKLEEEKKDNDDLGLLTTTPYSSSHCH